MTETVTLPELTASLCRDQRERWQRGERVPVEAYLERHPQLRADAENAADLVYHEVVLREERAEHPHLEEYLWRFPHLGEELHGAFEIHEAMERGPLGETRPGADSQRTAPAAETPAGPPDWPTVPGYEVLGEIGRGGMGVVYRARQVGLNRVVALKVILAGGHAGPVQRERFRIGAAACARLRHPHVVQIHDTGEHAGQPYVAMELVDGPSLAEHLAGAPLPPRDAAALTETLARTMQTAHEQGVIHRDLKPANILLQPMATKNTKRHEKDGEEEELGREPEYPGASASPAFCASSCFSWPFLLKITDFGLAKQLDAAEGLTPTQAILGTPSYMAPEQAAGGSKEVGPAADVYALGAILYELLTGRPPFRAATVLETLEQVRSLDPVPPTRLQPRLPRDLETICLKCLHKEPARRYARAGALADDLRRFLNGEPIMARPVPWIEVLWSWCRRNPLVAGLLAALALAIGGGVTGVTSLWLRAEQERRRAEDYAVEARQQTSRAENNYRQARQAVDHYFTEVTRGELASMPGVKAVRRRMLEAAAQYYQEFLREREQDPALRGDLARAYLKLAEIQSSLGAKHEAITALEKCRELQRQLLQSEPNNPERRSELAGTCNNLGSTFRELGRWAEALRAYEEGLRIREELVRDYPDRPAYRKYLAASYNNLGTVYRHLQRLDEALRAHHQAREILERAQPLPTDDPEFTEGLAGAYWNLGNVLGDMKQLAEAIAYYDRAVALFETRAREAPRNPAVLRSLAALWSTFGITLRQNNEPERALTAQQRAIAVQEALVLTDPEEIEYREDLSRSYHNLGVLYLKTGQAEQAVEVCQKAVALHLEVLARVPQVSDHRKRLSERYVNLAAALRGAGRAAPAAETTLKRKELWPNDPQELFNVARELAQCIPLVGKGKSELSGAEQVERKKYADLALESLRQAVRHGFAGVEMMRKDPELEPLRSYPDFKKLLAEVEAKR